MTVALFCISMGLVPLGFFGGRAAAAIAKHHTVTHHKAEGACSDVLCCVLVCVPVLKLRLLCFMQAYLMFGDRQYLDMFIELYAATMRHMKVGGTPVGL